MGAGSEAANDTSAVMGYTDAGAKTQPGLKSGSEPLHTHFARANEAAKTAAAPVK